jgi:hypothetical protein
MEREVQWREDERDARSRARGAAMSFSFFKKIMVPREERIDRRAF